MLYHLERRIKKEKKKPKPRSEKEQNYISNAKRLLMEKNQMTEEEAYRHIQKCSMDSEPTWEKTANQHIMKTIENMDHYGWDNLLKVTFRFMKTRQKGKISDGKN